MFERYAEKARRVIFFSRYEASQLGSLYIESEHLLLGYLRENKITKFPSTQALTADSIRQQIETQTRKRETLLTSVDLPMSRLFVRHKDGSHYEPVGTPSDDVSYESPVTCERHPVLIFNSVKWANFIFESRDRKVSSRRRGRPLLFSELSLDR